MIQTYTVEYDVWLDSVQVILVTIFRANHLNGGKTAF